MTDSATEELGFPSVTAAEWRARVEAELGALDFDRTLVAELEGVGRIEPLYTSDGSALDSLAAPGEAPFIRGASSENNEWTICPIYSRWSPEEVRREIQVDLRNGANAVTLRFDRAVRRGELDAADVGRDGIVIHRIDDLRNALDGVHLEMIRLRLDAGGRATEAAALLWGIVRERNLDAAALRVSFGFDPLGTLATDGALPRPLMAYGEEMAALSRRIGESMPEARIVAVSSRGYHNAGADPVLELACVIGALVEYLRMLGAAGVSPARAARQTELSIAVGNDLFVEIAKLRALRALWSRVLEVAGAAESVAPCLHAFSSERSLSLRDPWVNMLRVTSQTLAAAVGGADIVSTAGFDCAAGDSSELARRVARNTQLILAEESGLSQVVDPAGGSYFVESLTRQLAEAAWSRFQEFERAGGFARALEEGEIATRLAESWSSRWSRLARREPSITGVSAFPNLGEQRLSSVPVLPAEEARAIAAVGQGGATAAALDFDNLVDGARSGASVFELGGGGGGVVMDPLPRHSDAAPFEALHARGEKLRRRLDGPAVFLANIGRLVEHKPRSTFARDAFGVAGLEIDSGPGTEGAGAEEIAAELVGQFRASGARAICLCGTDEQYDTTGSPIAHTLARAGAKPLLIAGRPRSAGALSSAGVVDFLTAGGDLHSFLDGVLDGLEEGG